MLLVGISARPYVDIVLIAACPLCFSGRDAWCPLLLPPYTDPATSFAAFQTLAIKFLIYLLHKHI